MATCTDCDARIKYPGDGSQQNYTFPFEYTKTSEVHVSVYDEEQLKYVPLEHGTDWRLINATTVQLKEGSLTPIVIYRCTDLDHMEATFHPGHSVKAEDLNDDFNQLKFAIEESRCGIGAINDELLDNKALYLNRIKAGTDKDGLEGDLVKSNSDLFIDDEHVPSTQWVDNRYWDQCDETTETSDRWVDEIDDAHVPTTGAVEARLTELNLLTNTSKVTGADQRNKRWDDSVTDDAHVATTDALVERHDTYVNNSNVEFKENRYTQPGKFWVKDDENILFYRRDSGSAWIQLNTKGERGDVGGDSTVPGPAGTVEVGTTTTGEPGTPADVTTTGTPSAAILNFTIPKGEKGDDGGEILTFTKPLVKGGTTVSLDLQTIPNV